jgi:predicted transcriptional regulator
MKILLSIKPEYAEKILEGTKKFEFRRRVHAHPNVKTVIIYATMPVGQVIGEFSIECIHSAPPTVIWDRTRFHSGITRNFYRRYFSGRKIAHAIEIRDVQRYREPQPLKNFLPSGVAPQSYAYIPSAAT